MVLGLIFIIFFSLLTSISLSYSPAPTEHYTVCEVNQEDLKLEEIDGELKVKQFDDISCVYFYEFQSVANVQEVDFDEDQTIEIREHTTLSYDYFTKFKVNDHYRFSFSFDIIEYEDVSQYLSILGGEDFFEDVNIVETEGKLEQVLTEEFSDEWKISERTHRSAIIRELFIILVNVFLISLIVILFLFRKPKPKEHFLYPDWRILIILSFILFLGFSFLVAEEYALSYYPVADGPRPPEIHLYPAEILISVNNFLGIRCVTMIDRYPSLVDVFKWLITFYLLSCSAVWIFDRFMKR